MDQPVNGQGEQDTLICEDEGLDRGFVMLPHRLLRATNLSRDAKLLYAVLLSYAWQKGRCFPGYGRLCADLQASANMLGIKPPPEHPGRRL